MKRRSVKARKRICYILCTLLIISLYIPGFSFSVKADSSKVLPVNWTNIAAVGNQEEHSLSCGCFALAYCRTMLDGTAHSWAEYDAYGGGDQFNCAASWSSGGYHSNCVGSAQDAYRGLYDSINNNRPCFINVTGSRAYSHYLTVIGYQNVTDPNSLSASNFLIIDSCWFCSKSGPENMAEAGYYAMNDGGYHYYTTDSGSVNGGQPASPIALNTAVIGDYFTGTLFLARDGYVNALYRTDGDDIILKKYNEDESERYRFNFHFRNDGTYRITTVDNKLSMDVHGGGSANSTNISFFSNNDSDAQKWTFYASGSGRYVIQPSCARGSVMDVGGTNGSLLLWEYGEGNTNQEFYILPQTSNIPENTIVWNGHKYVRMDVNQSWSSANICANLVGGHLVSISSKEECDVVNGLITNGRRKAYWIGASDSESEGSFKWTTGEPFSYSNFGNGQPDNSNGKEDYVGVWRNTLYWNDFIDGYNHSDSAGIGYIVEFDSAETEKSGIWNDHEYRVINDQVTASKARERVSDGWYLATITSRQENDYIKGLINSFKDECFAYHIGGNDSIDEGNFIWETGEKIRYTNWDDNEPSNKDGNDGTIENYLSLRYTGRWNDVKEDSYFGYILERNLEPSTVSGQFNEHEYIVSSGRYSYSEAQTFLQDGWTLATITSKDENDYVKGLIDELGSETVTFWIGANDVASEGTFEWVTGEAFDYTNWAQGEPFGKNMLGEEEDYLLLTAEGYFNDANENTECGYVLERQHEHSWDKGKVTKNATCTEDGIMTYTCLLDSSHTKTEVIKSKGHVPVKDEEVPATCETTGLTEGSHCKECNAILVEQKVIPALEHDWDNGEITTEPTCTDKGVKTYKCTRCDAERTESVDALGHKIVTDEAVPATCTEGGLTSGSHCERCNRVFISQRETLPLGHIAAKDAGVEPTCTTPGLTDGYHCGRCGEILVEQESIPAKNHVWNNGTVTKQPSCKAEGICLHECTACGSVWVEKLEKTDHKVVIDSAVEAKCEETGLSTGSHCSVCGEVIVAQSTVPAKGHDFGDWELADDTGDVFVRTCKVCHKQETETHRWDAGTVIENASCTKAGIIEYKCQDCQTTKTDIIPAKGHHIVVDPAVDAKCTEPGFTEGSHCDVCNEVILAQIEIPALEHSWDKGVVTKKPACIEDGVRTYTCLTCGETYDEVIKAVGHHQWDKGTVIEPATCVEKGIRSYTCQVCDEVRFEDIPAKGHKLSHIPALEATVEEDGNIEYWYCDVCHKYYADENGALELSKEQVFIPYESNNWPFTDVAVRPGHWVYDGVKYAYENSLMSGDVDTDGDGFTNFRPKDNISRAEFVVILYNMAGRPKVYSAGDPFTDVKIKANGKKPYYYDAVVWAKITGVIAGYADGRFGVSEKITRADMAATLMRFAKDQGLDVADRNDISGMPDYGRVPKYAREAVSWANANGIINGKTINGSVMLAPRDNATRQECASILKRFYDACGSN